MNRDCSIFAWHAIFTSSFEKVLFLLLFETHEHLTFFSSRFPTGFWHLFRTDSLSGLSLPLRYNRRLRQSDTKQLFRRTTSSVFSDEVERWIDIGRSIFDRSEFLGTTQTMFDPYEMPVYRFQWNSVSRWLRFSIWCVRNSIVDERESDRFTAVLHYVLDREKSDSDYQRLVRSRMVSDEPDERNDVLVLFRYDEFLQWNPDDFNGIRRLNLPSRLIWLPDIVLYNVRRISSFFLFVLLALVLLTERWWIFQ